MLGINLYCANCGALFNTDSPHYSHIGTCTKLCSLACLEEMEYRYAAHILGKPTDRGRAQEFLARRRLNERTRID